MKKLLFIAICCLILCGCEKAENKPDTNKSLTKEQIVEKLMETNNWLTSIRNDGICEISHYVESGTNSIGQTADIDFILQNFNNQYNEKSKYTEFINSLNNEEYITIQNTFNKAIEQSDIIIKKVNAETPKAKTKVDYQKNIDLFNQYQSAFYDKVTELYYK